MQSGAGERGEHPRSRQPRLLLGSGSMFPLPSSTQRSFSQETCPSPASFPLGQVTPWVRAGQDMGWEPERITSRQLGQEPSLRKRTAVSIGGSPRHLGYVPGHHSSYCTTWLREMAS